MLASNNNQFSLTVNISAFPNNFLFFACESTLRYQTIGTHIASCMDASCQNSIPSLNGEKIQITPNPFCSAFFSSFEVSFQRCIVFNESG